MKPLVSIICNTYNQEKYIGQAMESFLMQKTDFPVEILVHDDASTDGTAEIVRRYAEKYPEIVKPLLQTENQYQKGVILTYQVQFPRASGKYIAFCEGDDYWTDENKLQMQFDFMESHPDYSACCHAYDMVATDGSLLEHRRDRTEDWDFTLPEFIGNQLCVPHFATLFLRREVMENCSGEFLGRRMDDMALRIRCTLFGKVRYFDRIMSAYRRFVEGSWTNRVGKNKETFADSLQKIVSFLEALDTYTHGEYHDAILSAADDRRFQAALLRGDYRAARKCRAFRSVSFIKHLGILIGCIAPKTVAEIEKIREGK